MLLYDLPANEKEKGAILQFRLTYQGPLPSKQQGGKVATKHAMRKHFHRQLAVLWDENNALRTAKAEISARSKLTFLEELARNYSRCGRRFVPLIREGLNIGCSLDVLLLRRDIPGGPIRSGGDVDNRIKMLLDALSMPTQCNQIPEPPQPDEDPFFCLLEDDKLITEMRVASDRLLLPRTSADSENDVFIEISVRSEVIHEGLFPALRLGQV